MNTSTFLRLPTQTKTDYATAKYEKLGLLENPFPLEASLNSHSDDPRVNGEVYADELHKAQAIRLLELLVPSPDNLNPRTLVFLMDLASRRGRGIGKSAFLKRQNEQIMKDLGASASKQTEVIFSVLISPSASSGYKKFSDFCRLVVSSLVDDGIITLALARIRALSGIISSAKLETVESIEQFQLYLHDDAWIDKDETKTQWDAPSRKVIGYVEKELRRIGLQPDLAAQFANYGTVEKLRDRWLQQISSTEWRRNGSTILFDWLPKVFHLASFSRGLLLIDEVEKIVTPMNQPEMRAFADCLRQGMFDGSNFNSKSRFFGMLLTVHPYIQELLAGHWEASGIDRLAPLSDHAGRDCRVEFPQLDMRMADPLVQVYLDRYRMDKTCKTLAPFDEQALVEAMNQSGRLPGIMLSLLHQVVEYAAKVGASHIDAVMVSKVAGSHGGTEYQPPTFIDELSAAKVDIVG